MLPSTIIEQLPQRQEEERMTHMSTSAPWTSLVSHVETI
jgi:hypothetical protein